MKRMMSLMALSLLSLAAGSAAARPADGASSPEPGDETPAQTPPVTYPDTVTGVRG